MRISLKSFKVLLCTLGIFLALGINCYASIDVDGTTFFEAEGTSYIHAPMITVSDDSASGGAYVRTENGSSINREYDKSNYSMTYKINVPKDDAYYVWMKVRVEDNTEPSYFASFDNGVYRFARTVPEAVEDGNSGKWVWAFVDKYYLYEGEHELNMIYRSANLQFDCFYITNDYKFTPEGADPFVPFEIYERDENGNITGELYYNLPSYLPPDEHPRLFFTKDDIAEIKANLTHPQNINEYNDLLADAAYDGDGFVEPLVEGKTDNFSTTIRMAIEANAFLYQLTGDSSYGYRAIELSRNYLKSVMCDHAATSPSNRGALMSSWSVAMCYDWCYDLLTEDDKDYLIYHMLFQFKWSETGYPGIDYLDHEYTGHIHEFQYFCGHFAVAIAVYDEAPDVYNVAAGRLLQNLIPTVNFFNQNGSYTEGSNYGMFRHTYEIVNNYMFRAMGYDNVYDEEGLRALSEFYLRQPDGQKMFYGDDGTAARSGYIISSGVGALFYLGNMLEDPYMKTEFFRTRIGTVKSGSSETSPALWLIVNNVDVECDRSFRDYPLTMFAGMKSGYMFTRTSWDEGYDANTVTAMWNLKPYYYHGHEHIDVGTFTLYYKGLLALDSGIYEGTKFVDSNGTEITSVTSGSVHNAWYAKRTIAHNTLLIIDPDEEFPDAWDYKKLTTDGYEKVTDGGQRIDYAYNYNLPDSLYSEDYQYTEILGYNWGPDLNTPVYTYMKGDMAEAYGYKAEQAQRTFMFFNFMDDTYPAALIVFDAVESSSPTYKKTWLLHSQEEPVIDGNNVTIVRENVDYSGRLINTTLMPTNGFEIKKIGGEGYEFYVNGENYEMMPASPVQEAGEWRVEISPTTAEKQSYLLNVIQLSENDDSIVPLEASLVEETDDYVGVEIYNHVAYMRKDGKYINRDFTINPGKSSEERFFAVTGLAEGQWTVYDEEGNMVAQEYAYEINDSISFTAKGSKFTLKYKYVRGLVAPDYSVYANKNDTEKGIDVQIDEIYETFENEWYEFEGTVFAPVAETLKALDITEFEEDFFGVKSTNPVKVFEFNYGGNNVTRFNGVIYAPVDVIGDIIGFKTSYDEIASIMRVTYGLKNRDRENVYRYNDPAVAQIAFAYTEGETTKSVLNSLDNNFTTYSVIQEEGSYTYVLEEESTISRIAVRWQEGNKRRMLFEAYVSPDGENWTQVFAGESDGVTEGFEYIAVGDGKKYKYIRLDCHGNNVNGYNSVNEFMVYK